MMCINLIGSMLNPANKLHTLPRPVGQMEGKETRSEEDEFYNF